MRHASLRQLKVFESIARNLSFTRAAEELHLTQPTVSMQIKKLTDDVGLPLFEQIGKRVHLTDAGRVLNAGVRDILDRLEQLDMAFADLKGLKTGRLRLAVVTTAKYFAPRLLGLFCKQHPGIEVSLNVSNREETLARLADNEDDLYILGQPPEELDVVSVPFLDNPLVIVAPFNHPLVKSRHIPLKRLGEEPILLREPGSGTRAAFERVMKRHGAKYQVKMEIGSGEAIKHAVAGGLGLTILSRHSLLLSGGSHELAILDVQHFPIERHWYVAYPSGKQLSVVASTFLDFLHKEAQNVVHAAEPASVGKPRSTAARKRHR